MWSLTTEVPKGYSNYPAGAFCFHTTSCMTGNSFMRARHQVQDLTKPDIGGSANRDAKAYP